MTGPLQHQRCLGEGAHGDSRATKCRAHQEPRGGLVTRYNTNAQTASVSNTYAAEWCALAPQAALLSHELAGRASLRGTGTAARGQRDNNPSGGQSGADLPSIYACKHAWISKQCHNKRGNRSDDRTALPSAPMKLSHHIGTSHQENGNPHKHSNVCLSVVAAPLPGVPAHPFLHHV